MKIDHIIIYDTIEERLFYPFSILHPVWELRAGALRLFEKYYKLFPDVKINYFSKNQLKLKNFLIKYQIENELNNISFDNNVLLCPANLNFTTELVIEIKTILESLEFNSQNKINIAFCIENNPVIYYINGNDYLNHIKDMALGVESISKIIENHTFQNINLQKITLINNLWELIDYNAKLIQFDSYLFKDYKEIKQDDFNLTSISGMNKVMIGKDVQIEPFTFFNVHFGDIIIDNNAKISSHTMIQGPCYIGENCVIKTGSKIYENSSFGEFCKIGGEVENSIFQSYSNKQHDGFIGHSFISEWVNLGAGTNNSDLKNNYSEISIRIENENINTNRLFLGMLMGDHTKSAIASRFNTGSVIGICSSIIMSDFPPKYVKSFSFGGGENSPKYDFDKAVEVAKKVTKRRNRNLLESEIELMKIEFNRNNNHL